MSAAATPLPETSARAMAMLMVTDLKEIVVVAANRPGGQTDRRQGSEGGLRRVIGQQTPLNFAGQCQIPPKFLLLDHAPGQPRILDRQRKLIGAIPQDHAVAGSVRLRAR